MNVKVKVKNEIFLNFLSPNQLLSEITEEMMNAFGQLSAFMTEVLTRDGVLLMRLFGRRDKFSADFHQRNMDVNDKSIKSRMVGAWFWMCLGLLSAVGTAVVYWYGGYLVINGMDLGYRCGCGWV
jgi:ATP-binding cassette, subfamily B, bacterial